MKKVRILSLLFVLSAKGGGMEIKMIEKLMEKYGDVIPYLFFGVCTTLVNVVAYWICAHLLCLKMMASTIIAWILAVLFAYMTNRKWVFRSEKHEIRDICQEMASFFGCRLATGIVDGLSMYVFVELLSVNDVFVKIAANILVIVLNYVASKLFIFKKKG